MTTNGPTPPPQTHTHELHLRTPPNRPHPPRHRVRPPHTHQPPVRPQSTLAHMPMHPLQPSTKENTMGIHELRKFVITCDGQHPKGGPCGCSIKLEAPNEDDAAKQALTYGWTTSGSLRQHWLCNAGDGHPA